MTAPRLLGRLAREEDFRRVYRGGTRRSTPLVVIHSLPNSLGQVRLGLAVGRRFGRAVSRNRLRRRMREAVREQAPRIRDGVDLVLTPTAAARNATFGALFQSVTAALAASHLLADAPGGPSTC